MKVEFLGSGGAATIPKPTCVCRVCLEARQKGVPYSRGGPSIFVHGPDILIDTPEDISHLLNRSSVKRISGAMYSHWHPDHVMGRRVWEMNKDWRNWPPQNTCTNIYLPEQVAEDFHQWLGSWDHFAYMQKEGLVRIHVIKDGQVLVLGDVTIKPFRLKENFVYGFLFESGGKRVLIIMDELIGWKPPIDLRGVDLAVLPMGIVEVNPFTNERLIPTNHPVLKQEATLNDTLAIVQELEAKKVILSHIEEMDGLSDDDLKKLEQKLHGDGVGLIFAHDALVVDV